MGRAAGDVHVLETCSSSVDLEEIIEFHAPIYDRGG